MGWVFHGHRCYSLVIVNQIHIAHITVIEPENNPPVARDSDAPESPQVTPQRMQPVTRQIDSFRGLRHIEQTKSRFNLIDQGRINPASVTAFVQPLQSSVAEALNHDSLSRDTCRVSSMSPPRVVAYLLGTGNSVAYLGAADNVSRLLPIPLRRANEPVKMFQSCGSRLTGKGQIHSD